MALTQFNQHGRTRNAFRASFAGITNQLTNIVLNFVFRMVFVHFLSVAYLGLNGLFSQILQILSLADLGIGTAIVYHMYRPIKFNDVKAVASYMNFYKIVYRVIFAIVLVLGLALMPLIPFLIKDQSEVPSDINLYLIYFLFMFQSASSYLYSYKQSIWAADQKTYLTSCSNIVSNVLKWGSQIVVVMVWKNYTAALGASIALQIAYNFAISLAITRQYRFVFRFKDKISKDEQRAIFKDTGALFLHRLGEVLAFSIDTLVITKLIGLEYEGVYSNYAMIITAILGLLGQLFGTFTSTIGNYNIDADDGQKRTLYFRIYYVALWASAFCTICLFVLFNPFFETVWFRNQTGLTFATPIVLALCAQFFIRAAKSHNGSFNNSIALFRKDRLRPIIEGLINLGLSILLAWKIGLIGIIVASIVSSLVTVWWREPYLLHKYYLKCKQWRYWIYYFATAAMTVGVGWATYAICGLIPDTFGGFVARVAICATLPNAVFALATFWMPEFKFFMGMIKRVLRKIFRKKPAAPETEGGDGGPSGA